MRAAGGSSAKQLRREKKKIKQTKGYGVERGGHGRILEEAQ